MGSFLLNVERIKSRSVCDRSLRSTPAPHEHGVPNLCVLKAGKFRDARKLESRTFTSRVQTSFLPTTNCSNMWNIFGDCTLPGISSENTAGASTAISSDWNYFLAKKHAPYQLVCQTRSTLGPVKLTTRTTLSARYAIYMQICSSSGNSC
jgi:hypothetical protein